jgi:hypothetical protein
MAASIPSVPELQKSQESLVFVEVQIRAMDHLGRLLAQHLHYARVPMAEGIHSDAAEQVEILLPVEVVDEASLATVKRQRIAAVVLKDILFFALDDLVRD